MPMRRRPGRLHGVVCPDGALRREGRGIAARWAKVQLGLLEREREREREGERESDWEQRHGFCRATN